MAMAPPLTLTCAASMPSSSVDAMATLANASFSSNSSMSSTVSVPSLRRASRMALAGWCSRLVSGPATVPYDTISAIQASPSSLALAFDIITTAAAPSESWDAEPAVIVPVGENAGLSFARVSTVESGRMPSSASTTTPFRVVSGTISSRSRPLSVAACARRWDSAANASCCPRVMPNFDWSCSVAAPMVMPSMAPTRASRSSASSNGRLP